MQKLKYLLLVLVSVLSTLILISSRSQAKTFNVGFLLNEFHTDRWIHDRSIFSKMMKAENINLYSVSARGSADLQVAQINQMINDGFDALIIVAVNEKKLTQVLKRAKRRHVIVIAYDKIINSGYISGYIGVDSKNIIKTQASEILNHTKQGNYIFVLKDKNNVFHTSLKEAFAFYKRHHKNDHKNGKNIHTYVVNTKNIHGVLDDLLAKLNYKVAGIFAYDDNQANSVISILHQHNIYSVYVTGTNATKDGIINILNGYQYSTIYRDIKNEATVAGKTVISLLKKQKLPKEVNTTISNPYSLQIPAYNKASTYITKANVSSLLTKNKLFSQRILKIIHENTK